MSETEIIAACEAYINRTFDEEDIKDLRKFLSGLQKQRTAKPTTVDKTKKLPDNLIKTKANPIIPKTSTEEKPSYIKEPTSGVDTSALLEERLSEIKGAGVKDRLGNWQEKIAASEDTAQTDPNLKAERLAEIKGAGVKDRLGNWQEKLTQDSPALTDPNLKAERLAEIKGAGVKDRLGNWQEKIAQDSPTLTDPNLKEERLAELKTVGVGLKDRLGAYQAKTTEEPKDSKVAERIAGVKQTTGVKDRLGAYQSATSDEAKALKKNVEEEVQEVKKVTSVQSRLANWNTVLAQDTAIVSDSSIVAERTAEAKASTALKDRVNHWTKASEQQDGVGPRKEPIKIDYGF